MFANKVCKQFEGAIILKHYPVLMPYSVLIAQIENPITASWQCSQLYNFTALCFLCGATWRDRYFTMNCQARSLSYRYSNKASISLESAQTYYQVCLFFSTDVTNRIGQQFGMYLAAPQAQAMNCEWLYVLLWKRWAVQQESALLFLVTLGLIWNSC